MSRYRGYTWNSLGLFVFSDSGLPASNAGGSLQFQPEDPLCWRVAHRVVRARQTVKIFASDAILAEYQLYRPLIPCRWGRKTAPRRSTEKCGRCCPANSAIWWKACFACFCASSALIPYQTSAGFLAVKNFTNDISLFIKCFDALHHIQDRMIGDDNDHADTHVKGARHLGCADIAAFLQKGKYGRNIPAFVAN